MMMRLKACWARHCAARAVYHLGELSTHQRAVTAAMRTHLIHAACEASREADYHARRALAWQDRQSWWQS